MSEQLDAAMERLAEGVANLRGSAGWKAWLDVAATMPNYSLNNQILIMMQKPDASMVAGFNRWKELGRHVTKGQTSIRILAPCTRKVDVLNPDHSVKKDPITGKSVTATQVVGFRAVPVFDVSQTDGEPIPEMPRPTLLEGQAPEGLWDALAEQVQDAGFELSRAENAMTLGGANGVTDYASRSVRVRADVSDAQADKTLAHELGHVLLHDPDGASWKVQCRGEKEVEAESVAYLIASHAGLDTAEYTFGYVAGWATDTDDNVLVKVADRIRTTAIAVIGKLEETMLSTEEPPALGLKWRTVEPVASVVEKATETSALAI